ncbi:DMT family transporter [Streptomyces sp. NPDC049952]|uniref:DMT family transporter n=1 Tax=Streptomyces TaxID=1883 RepID=UPI0004C50081|nr:MULTISPECIES: DMT family transporter [Streptomyces]MCY1654528.1 DMT family transporter [Streptomyces sp. SL203]MCY1678173.1 DMT family transporter [Streptomyces sp. SL294]MDX2620139.1 DMT family transporter [Streptomyces sp. WI03-5b]MEE1779124.1 DMT family transporter [Streptomyces sp. JV181]WJY34392.1 DMT family transporter [Streptomyces sp. P9-2B-1]
MISVLFAVLTALSNGTASVLQRRAALDVPDSAAMRLSLIGHLLRQKVWLAGIGLVIVAAVCQAVALATGPIAVVQPIFVIELPAALVVAGFVMRVGVTRQVWYGVAAVTAGLALGMAAAAPVGGSEDVEGTVWIPALVATGAFEAALIAAALGTRGNARAALLGLAAACGYALTAALMKDAMSRLDADGVVGLMTAWQLYATAAAGVGALFLLQNALQAGSLVAVQPMLTLGDALISITYGVTLFGEELRTGWWLVPQLTGVALVTVGCVVLARSPLATAQPAPSRVR